MRHTRPVAGLLFLGLLAAPAAADEKDDPIAAERTRLGGHWVATALHRGDKPAAKDALDKGEAWLVINGKLFTLVTPTEVREGLVTVDPSKSPRQMELRGLGKDQRVMACIYEADDTTLKIAGSDAKRPTDFEPKAGNGFVAAFKVNRGENLYRAAKVGDWLEFAGGDVVSRQTVTAKTDDSLTLKLDQTVGGKAAEPNEQRISLKLPYPPPEKPNTDYVTVREKLESAKDTQTVAGQAFACERVKTRTTIKYKYEGKEKTMVLVSTTWHSADLPLGGAVRVETELGDGKTSVMALTGYARGK